MRRSVSAFVLGLIGSIMLVFIGMIAAFIGGILADLIGAVEGVVGEVGEAPPVAIYGFLCFFGSILGIVGASLCFKRARVGGILSLIANAMTGVLIFWFVITCIQAGAFASTTVIFVLVLFSLPWVLSFVSSILALCAKKREA